MRSFGIREKVDLSPLLPPHNIRSVPGWLRAGPKAQHPGLGFANPSLAGEECPKRSSPMLPASQHLSTSADEPFGASGKLSSEDPLQQTHLLFLSPAVGAAPHAHLVDHDEAFGVDVDATLLEKTRRWDCTCGRRQGLVAQ